MRFKPSPRLCERDETYVSNVACIALSTFMFADETGQCKHTDEKKAEVGDRT